MCYLCRSKTTVLAGGRRRITDRFRFCARCEKIICDMEDKRLKATARLLEVMNTLRRECPWDREQTFDSLRSNTIEETYELADAITDHNMEGIKEELGDLLLHVVFYSKLGEEEGAFDFGDVADALCDKLIYRHPHVYGDIHANTPDQVKEKIVDGKLNKFYSENCLLQQAFVKENKISVEKHVAAVAKELGGQITVKAFPRFATGEGIEKKEDDFAAEVASMIH